MLCQRMPALSFYLTIIYIYIGHNGWERGVNLPDGPREVAQNIHFVDQIARCNFDLCLEILAVKRLSSPDVLRRSWRLIASICQNE